MTKVFPDARTALDGFLRDGFSIACGGFDLCRIPELLIAEVERSGIGDPAFLFNDGGTDDFGIGPMLAAGRCTKLVALFFGKNPALAQMYMTGKVAIEFSPQGTLDPDVIHLPGIYVHRILQGRHEKRIKHRTPRSRG